MAERSSRGNPAMADVVRSVAVLGLLIVVVWGGSRLLTDTPDQPTRGVDYAGAARNAQPAVDFRLLTPGVLPSGWRVTSARLDDSRVWRLGTVTADDEYVGLSQTSEPVRTAVRELAKGSEADGSTRIDGQEWARRRSEQGDVVLVRRTADSTLVITSSAGLSTTRDYVGTLSAAETSSQAPSTGSSSSPSPF